MTTTPKTRINITVDTNTLRLAKKKLHHFGGKLSTLINAQLKEFVRSINQEPTDQTTKIKQLEKRLQKIEQQIEKK